MDALMNDAMKNTNQELKLNLNDILLILTLLLCDVGTLGFLPLNFYQIIIIFMFFLLLIKQIKIDNRVLISKKLLFLLMYICIVTLFNTFDIDSIKSIGFFSIQIFAIFWYLYYMKDINKLLKIIYIVSFILSIFGIIQIIGFYLKIPFLYDISLYGFALNINYNAANGIFRPTSLYAEPAHLSAILSASIFIGLTCRDQSFTSKWKTLLMLVFCFFTKSTLVYLSVAIFILIYFFFFNKKGFFDKIKIGFIAIIFLLILNYLNDNFIFNVIKKLGTLFSASSSSTSDLSGFAVVSNLKIAILKMKDGLIFGTGLDSHRLCYQHYLYSIYDSVLMELNYNDAASLFIRIFSEFGIVGLSLLFAWIIKKLKNIFKNKNIYMTLFLVLFILSGLRNGHYNSVLTMISFSVIFFSKDLGLSKD